jgi:hypothetical protein
MRSRIVHVVVRLFLSVVLGAAAGALYAGLVGAVHLGAYGRWGGIAAFAGLCTLTGALCGLLGGLRWALAGGAARGKGSRRSLTDGSGHPGSARGSTDHEEWGRGRPPDRACYPAAGGEYPVRPGRFAWLCRGFEARN